jgi:hypothetical protein
MITVWLVLEHMGFSWQIFFNKNLATALFWSEMVRAQEFFPRHPKARKAHQCQQKQHGAIELPEFNLQHDWNSLLADQVSNSTPFCSKSSVIAAGRVDRLW